MLSGPAGIPDPPPGRYLGRRIERPAAPVRGDDSADRRPGTKTPLSFGSFHHVAKETNMPAKKLKEFLDEHQIKYTTIRHSQAFTAQEIAHSVHISGKDVAKTVIVKVDGKLAMVVLPASEQVVFSFLKDVTGADDVELATEQEFRDRFVGCEVGAMPPFGNLFGMDVYASESLAEHDEIAFNAGSHTELVRMRYDDYERLVRPKVVRLSYSDTGWV